MITNSKSVLTPSSGASTLYNEQRERELRKLLNGLRNQETQWMRTMRERVSLESATSGDEGDTAASDENREMTAAMAQVAGSRVAAVESALERLREGRYGICEECEEEIPIARLQAMPWTVLCVDCQHDREIASKRGRSDAPDLWIATKETPSVSDGLGFGEDGEPDVAESNDRAPGRRRGRPRTRARAA
jgi:DnaK suppressor protein